MTPALAWVLARAYGPATLPPETCDGEAAAALARQLGLAGRIAARQPPARLAEEAGGRAAADFKAAQMLSIAQQMRLHAALEDVDRAAADLGIAYAPLKGQALALGGTCLPGSRPFSDLDLLVPAPDLESLQGELVRRGFAIAGRGYEHHAPPLRHRNGGQVELHRTIPGVRLDPRHPRQSATFEALRDAQLLMAPSTLAGFEPKARLLMPSAPLLAAHALVHVLAQHGFAPAAYPGFLMLADLVDVGFAGAAGRSALAVVLPWIAREVSLQEAEAALDLATALAAGDRGLFEPPHSRARVLLDHFHAGATNPGYAESLKARMFERPPSDRPRPISRLQLLAATLVPPAAATSAGGANWWLPRFVDLVRRWRAARRSAHEVAGVDRR